MRRIQAGCLWGVVLSSLLGASCDGEDGAPGTGSSLADGEGDCARGDARLRACGLLGPGTAVCNVTAERREESGCTQACLEGAECVTLSTLLCSSLPPASTDAERLSACIAQCSEQFGFRCAAAQADGGVAVPSSFVCDGELDCDDGSDEVGCEQFDCGDGESVVALWFCDGVPDCSNVSDEGEGCEQLSCASGEQVPLSFECDGVDDCADGSDELDCDTATLQCP